MVTETDISSVEIAPRLVGKRAVVTGAGGFIGRKLVLRLAQLGAQVLAVDRDAERLAPAKSRQFDVACVDLADVDALTQAIAQFEPNLMYHLAASPDAAESFQQIQHSLQANLTLTVNALEAFHRAAQGLFVFADSSKVYGDPGVSYGEALPPDPRSSYAIAKGAGWSFCQYYHRLYDLPVVSLRPTLVYGPGQGRNIIQFVVQAIAEKRASITLMGGEQTRDPLYCDDVVDAFVLIATRNDQVAGRVINVGGGHEISVIQLAERIRDLMNADLEIQIDDTQRRPTDVQRSFCDNLDARRHLGWHPRHHLDAGLRKVIAAALAQQRPATVA